MANWVTVARRTRVPLGFAVATFYVWLARPSAFSIACGAILVIAGLILRGWASGHLQKNEKLATAGPYAYTRNPLYLGSLILAVGFALAARSWWVVAMLAFMFLAVYLPVIKGEENYLAQRFPEFPDYAREVPQLFPGFNARSRSHQQFSWALYRKHREYHATLGSVALMGVLAAKLLWLSK